MNNKNQKNFKIKFSYYKHNYKNQIKVKNVIKNKEKTSK